MRYLLIVLAVVCLHPTAFAQPDDHALKTSESDAPSTNTAIDVESAKPITSAAPSYASVFIRETPPPATLLPGQALQVSVTFQNNSGQTWTAATNLGAATGYKLGSQAPQDNRVWGTNRFLLPGNVASGAQVTVTFTIRAPQTAGTYGYSWAILNEGDRWLIPMTSPVHQITVGSSQQVQLCAGVTADATGNAPASTALQTCINRTPAGGTLDLPPGIFRMNQQIAINKPMTLRTVGMASVAGNCLSYMSQCAVLRADASLYMINGMLILQSTSDVKLDHLVLDGNRQNRLGSAAARDCPSNNRWGFNAVSASCARCSFTHSASINALCGTGFEWRGDDATITESAFRDNGDHNTNLMWADGLTLLQSDRARVIGNQFIDNSDVSFIAGGTRNGTFQNNAITQSRQGAFAALMLAPFLTTTSGDYSGTMVSGNNINCTTQKCDFGLMLGPHPWDTMTFSLGGTVSGNTIAGAKQGINVEGGGTIANPMRIFGNSVTGTFGSATFLCGTHQTSAYNISPDSRVDHTGESPGVTWTTFYWHNCP